MARKPGDTNYSAREQKLIAQNAELKAKVKMLAARVKVREAAAREVREKLSGGPK
jgi:hypothetical protein